MNNPFDWESFSKKLREQLPDVENKLADTKPLDFSWIHQYVEDVLNRTMPNIRPKQQKSQTKNTQETASPQWVQLKPKIMDTITDVIVRIDVPEGLNAKRIRIECNANRMLIRVLPQLKPQMIVMPARVLYRRAKAVHKHGVIEVKLPKHPDEETFQTIKINYEE